MPFHSASLRLSVLLCCAVVLLAACQAPAPATPAPEPGAPSALKMTIAASGLYALPLERLDSAGLSTEEVRLIQNGRVVPHWVQDGELRFYAVPPASRYTTENIYWLAPANDAWGWLAVETAGSRPAVTPPLSLAAEAVAEAVAAPSAAALGPDAVLQTVTLEQNERYDPQAAGPQTAGPPVSGTHAAGDPWLWSVLAAPNTFDLEVELPELAPGAAWARLTVYGSTAAPQTDPDHHLQLFVNEQLAAEARWDGKGQQAITAEIPAGVLRQGPNTLQVAAPGDTGALVEIAVIDRLELAYPRPARPVDGQLLFYSPGGEHRLSGFDAQSELLDVTDPYAPVHVDPDRRAHTGETLTFTGEAGRRYAASTAAGLRAPAAVTVVAPESDLRQVMRGADYLAIGPADLLAELEPLLALRREQGLQAKSVALETIYDQFNGGLPEPAAILGFLQYVYDHGQPQPRFVLLVGDGSYDPLGYQAAPAANRLPVIMVATQFGGETASDVAYAQMDADNLPDLALGRVPAQTPEQVRLFVEKTLAHERALEQASGVWPQSILAVADGQEAAFRYDAQAFLDLFPPTQAGELIAPAAGDSEAHLAIAQQWASGPGRLVAYFGHGSVNMWGKDRLFSTEDVAHLPSGQDLPVVMNMTCLNGLFTHATQESLAEALLWRTDGGAAAVLAPTSLTLPTDQSALSRPLVQALLNNPALTLGEALNTARRVALTDNPSSVDVVNTFLLFGDPALRLNAPGAAAPDAPAGN